MVCKQNCWMFGSNYQKFKFCYMIHVIAVHSLIRVESRSSAWVIRREFAEKNSFYLFHCGIVLLLLRIIAAVGSFYFFDFLKSCLVFCCPFKTFLLSKNIIEWP